MPSCAILGSTGMRCGERSCASGHLPVMHITGDRSHTHLGTSHHRALGHQHRTANVVEPRAGLRAAWPTCGCEGLISLVINELTACSLAAMPCGTWDEVSATGGTWTLYSAPLVQAVPAIYIYTRCP